MNDQVELSPRRAIQPGRDQLAIDGHRLDDALSRLVLACHKPAGLVTTRVEPGGRPTIYDVLGDVPGWVFPVGRLDRETSGLLVLTNDTRLGHRLTDPTHHVSRTYHARVRGQPDTTTLDALAQGVDLGDGRPTRAAMVRSLGTPQAGASTWIEIILTEGRNRQVRRMCARVGHDVIDLVRVAIGGLELGDLAPGEWRPLGPEEERSLLSS